VGLEIEGLADLPRLYGKLKGHPMARAGLEGGLWDLEARLHGTSLSHRLGGTLKEIEVGVSVGIQETPGALLARVHSFLEEGYRRVKIKIEPGWDVDIARQVRAAHPELRLWADANQAYRRGDLDRLKALDEFSLELLEQPLHEDDLPGHAAWAETLDTPLCLDEGVRNAVQLDNAIAIKALRILNIKPPRVGGVSAALKMEETCLAHAVSVWCGGLLETGIGRLHNIALASRDGFTLPGDLSASNRYFQRDLVDPPVRLTSSGGLAVPTGVGLGHDVDLDYLDAVTVRKATVRV
jgi:O-succinylbenzoate synthase